MNDETKELLRNATYQAEFLKATGRIEAAGIIRQLSHKIAVTWHSSGSELPAGLSTNPDGRDWADAFLATFPNCGADRDTMTGWFANAMMAQFDALAAGPKGEG